MVGNYFTASLSFPSAGVSARVLVQYGTQKYIKYKTQKYKTQKCKILNTEYKTMLLNIQRIQTIHPFLKGI